MARIVALIAALAVGFAVFYLDAVTPTPEPASAPQDAFSAGRAMADVRGLARAPHPLGSAANDAARAYVVGRLSALGLTPQVQHGSAAQVYPAVIIGGSVNNVIGVLPGRDRALPALVLMAHYDSAVGSPGAADDAAGVAAVLEVVRALKARGAPRRDVMVVITDGEESGLLGARVFFESPLAARVGYVLNTETRGGGGQTVMFETASGNGEDIRLYRKTAWRPNSNALTVFVYNQLPNDTDFTVVKQHGKVGLNYAFIGRQFDYHSPSSTPEALDEGSLQHMGGQILPTARALAFGPLPGRAPDVVYGKLFGSLTPAYDAGFGWVLIAAAAVLTGLGAWTARRRRALELTDVARGVGASLYALAITAVCLVLVRQATGVAAGFVAYRAILARFPLFEVMMGASALAGLLATGAFAGKGASRGAAAGLALCAAGAAVLVGGFDLATLGLGVLAALIGLASFGAPAKPAGAWTGVLALGLLAGIALQIAAPAAAFVLVWPLAAASLASAVTLGGALGADRPYTTLGVLAVIAAGVLAWLLNLFHFLLQGLDLPMLAAAPVWIALLALWPLLAEADAGAGQGRAAIGVLLIGLLIAGVFRFASPWSPRHPNAVEPIYVVDAAKGKAWRASLVKPDAWSRSVLTAEGGRLQSLALPLASAPVAAAPARLTALAPPAVALVAEPGGRTRLMADVHPGAVRLYLRIKAPGGIDQVRVNGQPAVSRPRGKPPKAFEPPGDKPITVVWSGPERLTLSFRAKGAHPVEVQSAEIFDRWMSATPLPPAPKADQLWDWAGASVSLGAATAPASR